LIKYLVVGNRLSVLAAVSKRIKWCKISDKEFKYDKIRREIETEFSTYKYAYFNEIISLNTIFDRVVITSSCDSETLRRLMVFIK
jgi:glycyl-tRNA synthetase alpha subunit